MPPAPASRPSHPDSLPPGPDGSSVESRLTWLEEVARLVWRRQRAHEADDAEVHEEVRDLAESLGREGNADKGRAATGLHLAYERGQKATAEAIAHVQASTATALAALHTEIAVVLQAVHELRTDRDADRTSRLEAIKIEEAQRLAVAKVKEPVTTALADARKEAVRWAVLLILGAIAVAVSRHWH